MDIFNESVLFILVRKSGKFQMKRGNTTLLTCIDHSACYLHLRYLCGVLFLSVSGLTRASVQIDITPHILIYKDMNPRL